MLVMLVIYFYSVGLRYLVEYSVDLLRFGAMSGHVRGIKCLVSAYYMPRCLLDACCM